MILSAFPQPGKIRKCLLGLFLVCGILLSRPLSAQEQTGSGNTSTPAASEASAWWRTVSGPAYQVLVYSFADSKGDGWGNLRGLIDHLDWLNDGSAAGGKDLRISAIWLSPINTAGSYHGYDVIDYKSVSPNLGNMADFDELVKACHARGIHVILDEVFNHTSSQHPWFKAMIADPTSPYAQYYCLKKPGVSYGRGGLGQFYNSYDGDGDTISYFSSYSPSMPDLDCGNPAVVGECRDILKFWLSHGVDGFRFDSAPHIFDPNKIPSNARSLALNRAFWNGLRDYARQLKPDVLFIGEVLSESPFEVAAYSTCFDMLFDFPMAKQIRSLGAGSGGSSFPEEYMRNAQQYMRDPNFVLAPLLANHDQDRIMSLLLQREGANPIAGWGAAAGDTQADKAAKQNALDFARFEAAVYLTLPGLPFIYYGEELGMTGRRFANDDVARRDAFPWTKDTAVPPTVSWTGKNSHHEPGENVCTPSAADQAADQNSLLAAYRSLAAFRASLPGIATAKLKEPDWPGLSVPGVLSWVLELGPRHLLVVHAIPGTSAFSLPSITGASLKLLWSSTPLEKSQTLPAGSSAVYEISGN